MRNYFSNSHFDSSATGKNVGLVIDISGHTHRVLKVTLELIQHIFGGAPH